MALPSQCAGCYSCTRSLEKYLWSNSSWSGEWDLRRRDLWWPRELGETTHVREGLPCTLPSTVLMQAFTRLPVSGFWLSMIWLIHYRNSHSYTCRSRNLEWAFFPQTGAIFFLLIVNGKLEQAFSEVFHLSYKKLEMSLVNHSDLGIWSPFTIQHLFYLTFPQIPTAAFARLSTEFWSVSHYVFHNSYFIVYACFLLSKDWNQKQEMFIRVNRIYEWENAKTNGHGQKYSCSGVQEGQMSFSECVVRKLKLLMVLGINPYKF